MTVTKIALLTAAVSLAVGGGAVTATTWQNAAHRVGAVVTDAAPASSPAPAGTLSPADVTWGG